MTSGSGDVSLRQIPFVFPSLVALPNASQLAQSSMSVHTRWFASGFSRVNSLMAFTTDHQRLLSTGSYDPSPLCPVTSSWSLKISELAHMMHFHLVRRVTSFAGIRQS
jgi:hypothetical protein